ncbi:hypothetical protein [Larkinella soli]|uniref:hypothetical protein n=1 Tax=Larkinella soli TaxID=1770527 RepID=UPI000FFBE4B5|nr:hypothetical protein [Larkinella soli]
MKKILSVLGLTAALVACHRIDLSPVQETAGSPEKNNTIPGTAGRTAGQPGTAFTTGRPAPLTGFTLSRNAAGTYDIVFRYDGRESETVQGIGLREAARINDLLRWEQPVDYEINRNLIVKWEGLGGQAASALPDLFAWLQANPKIAGSIVWEDGTGIRSWPSWSALQQTQLWVAFQKAWQGSSIYVPEIPANLLTHADDEGATTVYSVNHAWGYFRASVGHALALELGHRVSWSVLDYSDQQLAQLFSGREMFYWNDSPQGYLLSSGYHGAVTPGPPLKSYQFMKDNGMISPVRLTTISRAVNWARFNLTHYLGRNSAGNMEAHWQYRGAAPMARVLSGTLNPERPEFGLRHWTAGCGGTAGFFRMLLRSVNIPVKMVFGGDHAQVWFMSDNYYLDHADAPYDAKTKYASIGAGELLIHKSRYEQWFGPNFTDEQELKNVGRRSRELAIAYLPNYVLNKYCEDMQAGKSHADGYVYEMLSKNYTVAQLEAQNFWGRMDAKIYLMGGCSAIPD